VVVEHDAAERSIALEARDEVAPPRRRLGGLARDAVASSTFEEGAPSVSRPAGLVVSMAR
jgi:hypothetical protein